MTIQTAVKPTTVYAVRMTPEERASIETAAKLAKLTLSDWARRALRERAYIEAGTPLERAAADPKAEQRRLAVIAQERILAVAMSDAPLDTVIEYAFSLRRIGPATPTLARWAVQCARARQKAQNYPTDANKRAALEVEKRFVYLRELARSARDARLASQPAPSAATSLAGPEPVRDSAADVGRPFVQPQEPDDGAADVRDILSNMSTVAEATV